MKRLSSVLKFLSISTCFCSLVAVAGKNDTSIKTYFNHNVDNSYTDSYRGITKPGDNFEAIILERIGQASRYIDIAVQELRLPSIASALIQKKNEGVKVRVILENSYHNTILTIGEETDDESEHDAMRYQEFFTLVDVNGNGTIEKAELNQRDAVYMLQKAGISIRDDKTDLSAGSGLMHHKFIVIDGTTTIITSANFTLSDFHGDFASKESQGNQNALMVVESSELARVFQSEYNLMWGKPGVPGLFGLGKPYRGPMEVMVGDTSFTIQFSPTSTRMHQSYSVNGLIESALKDANNEILMALFVFSDQKLVDAIYRNKAKNSKLKVSGLFEPKFAYRNYSELLDMWGLKLLDESCAYETDNHPWRVPNTTSGVVNLPRGDMLHHKFGVIDQQTVLFGSHNWSDAANNTNDEFIVMVKDKNVAKAFVKEHERLALHTKKEPPTQLLSKIEEYEAACNK